MKVFSTFTLHILWKERSKQEGKLRIEMGQPQYRPICLKYFFLIYSN